MDSFPLLSLLGGALLGCSGILLLLFNGKIAGISGILGGLFTRNHQQSRWRWLFIAGMISGGFLALPVGEMPSQFTSSPLILAIAGLLVGIGTKLGNGCTSGHGICGIGRLSLRSFIATVTFMVVAAITVFLQLHLF
ncbi:YeeE/YedE family protein [Parashewanella curva]|uniref:YeeE/YedE family protein n=1 Tax=Parashewanella curva TaxID=2338552 RepID=A0A3L8PTK8_9GAMM|nr:YeeE/YedE thiosulfate transporter family protein [Parashewanella curva]RLV58731.1 YeeE/YedE family protein [Parashewanella curva]